MLSLFFKPVVSFRHRTQFQYLKHLGRTMPFHTTQQHFPQTLIELQSIVKTLNPLDPKSGYLFDVSVDVPVLYNEFMGNIPYNSFHVMTTLSPFISRSEKAYHLWCLSFLNWVNKSLNEKTHHHVSLSLTPVFRDPLFLDRFRHSLAPIELYQWVAQQLINHTTTSSISMTILCDLLQTDKYWDTSYLSNSFIHQNKTQNSTLWDIVRWTTNEPLFFICSIYHQCDQQHTDFLLYEKELIMNKLFQANVTESAILFGQQCIQDILESLKESFSFSNDYFLGMPVPGVIDISYHLNIMSSLLRHNMYTIDTHSINSIVTLLWSRLHTFSFAKILPKTLLHLLQFLLKYYHIVINNEKNYSSFSLTIKDKCVEVFNHVLNRSLDLPDWLTLFRLLYSTTKIHIHTISLLYFLTNNHPQTSQQLFLNVMKKFSSSILTQHQYNTDDNQQSYFQHTLSYLTYADRTDLQSLLAHCEKVYQHYSDLSPDPLIIDAFSLVKTLLNQQLHSTLPYQSRRIKLLDRFLNPQFFTQYQLLGHDIPLKSEQSHIQSYYMDQLDMLDISNKLFDTGTRNDLLTHYPSLDYAILTKHYSFELATCMMMSMNPFNTDNILTKDKELVEIMCRLFLPILQECVVDTECFLLHLLSRYPGLCTLFENAMLQTPYSSIGLFPKAMTEMIKKNINKFNSRALSDCVQVITHILPWTTPDHTQLLILLFKQSQLTQHQHLNLLMDLPYLFNMFQSFGIRHNHIATSWIRCCVIPHFQSNVLSNKSYNTQTTFILSQLQIMGQHCHELEHLLNSLSLETFNLEINLLLLQTRLILNYNINEIITDFQKLFKSKHHYLPLNRSSLFRFFFLYLHLSVLSPNHRSLLKSLVIKQSFIEQSLFIWLQWNHKYEKEFRKTIIFSSLHNLLRKLTHTDHLLFGRVFNTGIYEGLFFEFYSINALPRIAVIVCSSYEGSASRIEIDGSFVSERLPVTTPQTQQSIRQDVRNLTPSILLRQQFLIAAGWKVVTVNTAQLYENGNDEKAQEKKLQTWFQILQ